MQKRSKSNFHKFLKVNSFVVIDLKYQDSNEKFHAVCSYFESQKVNKSCLSLDVETREQKALRVKSNF